MTYRLAYNTTDRQVVVDPAGRFLGGHEHGPVDSLFDEVTGAVDRGELVYVTRDEDVAELDEAVAQVVELIDRRQQLLDDGTPSDLRALADRHGLPSDEQTPTALAAMLAPTGASLDELAEDSDDTDESEA